MSDDLDKSRVSARNESIKAANTLSGLSDQLHVSIVHCLNSWNHFNMMNNYDILHNEWVVTKCFPKGYEIGTIRSRQLQYTKVDLSPQISALSNYLRHSTRISSQLKDKPNCGRQMVCSGSLPIIQLPWSSFSLHTACKHCLFTAETQWDVF